MQLIYLLVDAKFFGGAVHQLLTLARVDTIRKTRNQSGQYRSKQHVPTTAQMVELYQMLTMAWLSRLEYI